MGIIIAKFRKRKSTEEVLDTLDKEIKSIETFRRTTEQAHKKTVGRFLLISVIVYLGTAFLFYFYFFPASFYDRLFYIIPLILAPVIIISTKKGLTWYYNRKITKKQLKLEKLHDEKKIILDKVMETETYKVAKNILEKYAPEQIKKSSYSVPSLDMTPVKPNNSISFAIPPTTGLRHRAVLSSNQPLRASFGGFQTPSRPTISAQSATATRTSVVPVGATSVTQNLGLPSMPLPLPRAILPRERSVLDKMVEYLVGDGPSNRYALICKQCSSHNGMALKEEFEYLSFRCCYCYTFNPARKKRPFAPGLEYNKPLPIQGASDTSESEKNSPSDSDSDLDKGKIKVGEIIALYTSEESNLDKGKTKVGEITALCASKDIHSYNARSDVQEIPSEEVNLSQIASTPVYIDSEFEKLGDSSEEIPVKSDSVDGTEAKYESHELS